MISEKKKASFIFFNHDYIGNSDRGVVVNMKRHNDGIAVVGDFITSP